MLSYLFLGLLIGVLSGIPIGPVNVAVLDTSYRHSLRRAVAVSLGGALGDGVYSMLGILGVGPYLDEHPSVPPVLYAVSGAILLVYGIVTVRSKPSPSVTAVKDRADNPSYKLWSGFVLGFVLIILNPAALVTWVIIVGSFMHGITNEQGIGATIGITVGSFVWFSMVAVLSNHGKRVLGGKAVHNVTRFVGVLLIGYSLYTIGKAIHYWFF